MDASEESDNGNSSSSSSRRSSKSESSTPNDHPSNNMGDCARAASLDYAEAFSEMACQRAAGTLAGIFSASSQQERALYELDVDVQRCRHVHADIGHDITRGMVGGLIDNVVADHPKDNEEGTIWSPRIVKTSSPLRDEYEVSWDQETTMTRDDPVEVLESILAMLRHEDSSIGVADQPAEITRRRSTLRLIDKVRFHSPREISRAAGELEFNMEPCRLMVESPCTEVAAEQEGGSPPPMADGPSRPSASVQLPPPAQLPPPRSELLLSHPAALPDAAVAVWSGEGMQSNSGEFEAGESQTSRGQGLRPHELVLRSLELTRLRVAFETTGPPEKGEKGLSKVTCSITIGLRATLPLPWWLPSIVVHSASKLLIYYALGELCDICAEAFANRLREVCNESSPEGGSGLPDELSLD